MFQQVLEVANEAVLIVDLHSNVKYVNTAYEKLFQTSRENVVGKQLNQTVRPIHFKHRIITETIKTKEEQNHKEMHFHFDGKDRYLSGYTKLIEENGETVILTMFQDVTCYVAHRKQQVILIEEMTANIVPLSNGFALLPLQPILIEEQKKLILEKVPQSCANHDIEYLIIQMNGITEIDDELAHLIDNLINVLKLLGIEPTISGINPQVASSFVRNQLSFAKIPTFSNMKDVVAYYNKVKPTSMRKLCLPMEE
ncbi:PAS domain-containing protein [Bacillus solimangrovi]|uniref:PAS domain-containing protein n=1 Tax=Bacillus solimangrovi TaxID=1305675 RepID=A0A1E5LCF7_9BACI|nr:PAS domain-containing protein [Bacillus solimangrovi]OEH91757.1 hypothetical protein BFG57_17680 [Bacillus solimangrovi]